ncbi:hypothetical protein OZX73_01360 [Bifidobacterium sp. ESL0775]|uniref:hypothetical protein n=1 Tax=Bifidobacterium sp. ESL0775 TaxID=2983230 RepID=UPI0023F67CDA|nr:hypothetical protein [Bifidobacterium sp. ESL0775]WEV69568.1 hypothetical protein OZX73_01360 [Bifidobacterium sp. ESL0775]
MTKKNDSGWAWDDAKAVKTTGTRAQAEMDALLMRAAGTESADEAERVLLGRPRAGQAQPTVKLQVRVPESWERQLDTAAKKLGESRSEWLRRTIHGALQTA